MRCQILLLFLILQLIRSGGPFNKRGLIHLAVTSALALLLIHLVAGEVPGEVP